MDCAILHGGEFENMASKRKSIAQLKSGKKQKKKLKDEDYNGNSPALQLSMSLPDDKSSQCEKINNVGKSLTSSAKLMNEPSIISCFRKQKQQETKSVSCPVCERMVFYQKINQHLDGGCCEKFLVPCENNLVTSKSQLQLDIKCGEENNEKCQNDHMYEDGDSGYGLCRLVAFNDTTPASLSLEKSSLQTSNENDMFKSSIITDISKSNVNTTSNTCSEDVNLNINLTSNVDKTQVLAKKKQININEKLHVSKQSISCSSNHSNHTISSSELDKIENFSDSIATKQIILDEKNLTSTKVNADENNIFVPLDGNQNSSMDMVHIISSNVKTQVTNPTNDGDSTNFYEPYYLQNFMLTLNTVLSHDDDRRLFDESDNAIVKSFQNLSDCAKKLYVRLFQRKFKWFPKAKIQYQRIGDVLEPFFQELIDCGFLDTEVNLLDLEVILNLLPASDIQDLSKSMHIMNKNEGRTKKQLMHSLIKHSTKQRSLFAQNGDKIAKAILKRAKTLLGPCVKLITFPRNVFSRVLLLFTLNLLADDDDNTGSQLSALFLINIGRIVYPSYKISRETPIFQSRDELIKYEMANHSLCRMDDAMENKHFDEARNIFENIKEEFMQSMNDLAKGEPRLLNSVSLPIHLRRFTCTWLYTKMCSKGVELLQRDRQYQEAVLLLRRLLGQNEFCVSRRGWWWERLALNLDQHLKKPSEALDAVKEGLSDIRVRTGHRFALEQRAKKICEAKRNSSLHKHLTEIRFTELKQPRVVTISGKRLSNEPVFVLHEVNVDGSVNNDVVSYCGVEEMALRYYRQQGYNEGIHGEGSTFNSLFGLLMWDVIFAEGIPDVFRTPFQAAPLDIYCDNFYVNRKELIQKRLSEIRNASAKELVDWIDCTWEKQLGKTCVGINWDLFSGVEQIKELTHCIGNSVLAGICEQFAKDYRHTRSGLPDLVVWNSSSLKYKIIEVKGPNDRLSTKQHVWLDVLVSLGVDAEVLYVEGALNIGPPNRILMKILKLAIEGVDYLTENMDPKKLLEEESFKYTYTRGD